MTNFESSGPIAVFVPGSVAARTFAVTIGTLPVQALFTAPTVGAAIVDAAMITGALSGALFLGSQVGSAIAATANRITCH